MLLWIFSISRRSGQPASAYKTILEIICVYILKVKQCCCSPIFKGCHLLLIKYFTDVFTSQTHTGLYLPFGKFIYLLD